jgi:hypothetical protein
MKQKHFIGNKLLYKATVKSILIYEANTWTLKQQHKNKLLATELDYWRQLAKISTVEKTTNETI